MKTTNAIEEALKIKIDEECREIVEKFTADLRELSLKYGGSKYYNFDESSASDARGFMVNGIKGVGNAIHRMILENHGRAMLTKKSSELIKKLNLDI